MAFKIMTFFFAALFAYAYGKPAIAVAPAAVVEAFPVAPVASTYSASVINHAVSAPLVAAAPAPYVAAPYYASPYSAYYGAYPYVF